MSNSLDKFIVWVQPDSSLSITTLDTSSKRVNETEDEFIARSIAKLQEIESFKNLTYKVLNRSELPINPIIGRWRLKNDRVIYDDTVILQSEINKQKKDALIAKLKSQLSLSDDEVSLILGR